MMQLAVVLLLAVLAVLPSAAAGAQDVGPLPAPFEPLEPRQLARSGFAPPGAALGGVQVDATAAVDHRWRSERYGGQGAVAESRETRLTADLTARAGSPSHTLEARLGLDARRGTRGSADRATGGEGAVSFRMPLGPSAVLEADAGLARRFEPRTTPLAEGFAAAPTPRTEAAAGLAVRWRPGVLEADLTLRATRDDYDDVPRLVPGWMGGLSIINNDDRDRLRLSAAARLGWRPAPLSALYVEATASRIAYAADRDDLGFDRDGRQVAWAVGAEAGQPRLWRAFVEAGVTQRMTEDAALGDAAAVMIRSGATVAVTPLMTAQVRISSALAETTEPLAPAVLVRAVALEVEHELLRSLVLVGRTSVETRTTLGALGTRDTLTVETALLRWRLGQGLTVEGHTTLEQLEGAWTGDSYRAAEAGVRLLARY